MAGQLAGRTALITGGSRGIGRAIALLFAREGADIAFAHLHDTEAAKTECELKALGAKVLSAALDVADLSALRGFVDLVEQTLGTPHILVNNAGGNIAGSFDDLTEADYDRQMDVNLKATVLLTRLVYPAMKARGEGRIINISSQLGLRGAAGMVVYSAAKAGVVGFTRALAHEATEHGILVNAIAPGPVDTAATRVLEPAAHAALCRRLLTRRFAQPEEIAATALLLAGPGGTFYAGACLSPNGGDVMH